MRARIFRTGAAADTYDGRVTGAPAGGDEATRERFWKANLFGASVAAFLVMFGMFLSNPLMPSFLHRELGLEDPGAIAFWSGLSAAVPPMINSIASPIWGRLADRFGRRGMLARAVAGAGCFTASIALVQNTAQLVAMRALGGLTAGVNPASLALVASEMPRRRLGQALGMLTTARSLGQTVGPAVGGIAGTVLPLRAVFAASGLVILAGLAPVLLGIHETTRPEPGSVRPSVRSSLQSAGAGVRRAVVTVVAAQALAQFALAGAQQLILVRVLEVDPAGATLGSGFALAALSLSGALAGILYPQAIPLLGYRRIAIASAFVLAAAVIAAAQTASVAPIIATAAIFGLGYGSHSPATASMLGLETPNAVKGTIFGLSASAQQIGWAGGALGSGVLAVAFGTAGALVTIALAAFAAAAVIAIWGREPELAAEPAR